MKKSTIKYFILAFLIPFFICLIASYCKTFIFGGPKNILISDMQGQYVSLFSYLQDVMNGEGSLFYSFSKSLGGNMFGTFAYYLASPLNLILIFFSKVHLTWGLLLLVVLKISLSGLTMYIYLYNKFSKDRMLLLLFSTCYALIAYNVNYFFNIMWLDAVYFAPLILLGIDNIIKKKSSIIYGIFLFFAILSNYYIGYMLCILSCIYFIYQLILTFDFKKEKYDIINLVIKFGFVSLISGLMTFFLLMPTIIELQNSQRAFGNIISSSFKINFNIFDILSRLFISSHNNGNILSFNTAAIYSGLIIIPLVFFYFFNDKFKFKEKILDGSILIILILSIMVPHLSMIWHGINFPQGFNYRFSFILSLFLILVACKSFFQIKRISIEKYLLFYIGYIIVSLVTLLIGYEYLSIIDVYISVGCVGLYLVLLYSYGRERIKKRKILIKFLLLFLVLAELLFNFFLSIRDYKVGYENEFNGYMTTMLSQIDKYKAPEDDFYRIEKNLNLTYIDSLLFNYESFTIFLSTFNKKNLNFFNNIGANVRQVSVDYRNGTTPVLDSILGMKYHITASSVQPDYQVVDAFQFSKYTGLMYGMAQTEIKICENPNALPLGFMVDEGVKDFTKTFIDGKKYTNFDFQNTMLQTMVNNKNEYLKPYNVEAIDENNYIIDVSNDKDFYVMIPFGNEVPRDAKTYIYINDEAVKNYSLYDAGIFLVNNEYASEKIKLTIIATHENAMIAFPSVYYMDYDLYEEDINKLKENPMSIEKRHKNYIKGTVNVLNDKKVLFTSIPYEKGWSIKVDGKKVNYYKLYDAFIGIDLEEGNHELEFTFYPPGLKIGFYISLISTIMFILFIWKEKQIMNYIINSFTKYEQVVRYLFIGGLTTIVNFITYILFAKVVGFDYIISSVIAWVVAVLFAYITNKIFVFKDKVYDVNKLLKQLYKFFQYRLVSLGADLLIMFIMIEMLFADDVLAKVIAQFIVVILNYVFSKIYVFKKP